MRRIYLDVDGVLLGDSGGNTVLAQHAYAFVEFILGHFDVYWLTTHCQGDAAAVLTYLTPYTPPDLIRKLQAVRPTSFQVMKTEALDGAFGESLAGEAKRFKVAVDIRRYLRALRHRRAEAVAAGALVLVDEAWLQRADRFADSIDPVLQHVPLPTQGRCPQNLPVADLDITCDLRLWLAKLGVADLRAMYELKREQLSRGYRDELWRETCQILEIHGYGISGRLSEWERYRV